MDRNIFLGNLQNGKFTGAGIKQHWNRLGITWLTERKEGKETNLEVSA